MIVALTIAITGILSGAGFIFNGGDGSGDGAGFSTAGGVSGIFSASPGGAVVIRVDGEIWRRLPLGTDTEAVYESGGRRNVISLKGGTARMEEANCPDRLCVKRGGISDTGAVIVCLPNRVSVKLEKPGGNINGVDVIVYNCVKTPSFLAGIINLSTIRTLFGGWFERMVR